ncbi:MAG: signal peptidase II [Planctomycetes bacterium]|nr:signal peptidase II [Planctomycetota bacterium]
MDQWTKWWLFSLPDTRGLPSWISRAENTGVAWSIGHQVPALVALVTLILIPVLCWVWWRYFRPIGPWENLAFGAILGGAVGNGIDRLLAQLGHLRGVRDFIYVDLGVWPADPWPTFNIADAGISCGFLVLVVLSFRKPQPAASSARLVSDS